MKQVIMLLALSDDYTVIRALEYFNKKIRQDLDTPFEELLANNAFKSEFFPDKDSLDVVQELDGDLLNEVQSQLIARRLLLAFASQPKLTSLVLDALQNWPDQTKKVGVTLRFGIVASLLLIVASTEIEYKGELISLHKKILLVQNKSRK